VDATCGLLSLYIKTVNNVEHTIPPFPQETNQKQTVLRLC